MPCHAIGIMLQWPHIRSATAILPFASFSWQAVTRIGASPAEIASFLSNSYGPSWDTAIAQERLVELLSDSAQVRHSRRPFRVEFAKPHLASIMMGIRQTLWLLRWSGGETAFFARCSACLAL